MNALTALMMFTRRCAISGFTLVTFLISLGLNSSALAALPETPTLAWVREFGTLGQDVGEGIAADPSGNVYVSGAVSGNLAAPFAGGLTDVFVRKYDASGSALWTRQFGTGSDEESNSVSIDGFGSIYISGWTRGSIGGPNLGAEDAFVRKYDPSGNVVWTRQLGTVSNDVGLSVSADALGNAYITGYTNGSFVLPNTDDKDMFVAKYDPSGSLLWTRQYSPNHEQIGFGVSTDSVGNVYVTGYSGNTNIPGGIFDPFLNKYDSSGNLLWTRQLGNTHNAASYSVSADNFGHVYIGGQTGVNLGGGPIAGQGDAFVAQYSQSGDLLWVRQIGTTMNEVTNGVSTDALGNVYLAGNTTGNLGSTNFGVNDAFLVKFDAAGNLRSVAQIGTGGSDQAYAVSADQAGNAYITGYATGGLFGAPSAGNIDAYVAKYSAIPEPAASMIAVESAGMILVMFGRFSTRNRVNRFGRDVYCRLW